MASSMAEKRAKEQDDNISEAKERLKLREEIDKLSLSEEKQRKG